MSNQCLKLSIHWFKPEVPDDGLGFRVSDDCFSKGRGEGIQVIRANVLFSSIDLRVRDVQDSGSRRTQTQERVKPEVEDTLACSFGDVWFISLHP